MVMITLKIDDDDNDIVLFNQEFRNAEEAKRNIQQIPSDGSSPLQMA